jgi:hypothetical protein
MHLEMRIFNVDFLSSASVRRAYQLNLQKKKNPWIVYFTMFKSSNLIVTGIYWRIVRV